MPSLVKRSCAEHSIETVSLRRGDQILQVSVAYEQKSCSTLSSGDVVSIAAAAALCKLPPTVSSADSRFLGTTRARRHLAQTMAQSESSRKGHD